MDNRKPIERDVRDPAIAQKLEEEGWQQVSKPEKPGRDSYYTPTMAGR